MASVTTRPQYAIGDPIDEALAKSESSFRSPRMLDAADTDALQGEVRWKPVKSLWISTMTLTALIAGPMFFTWGALALFLATTAVTVCLGHSLGSTAASSTAATTARCGWSACSSISARWSAWPAPTA